MFNDQKVNTMMDANGAPWWIAKEVCDILGLTNVTNALAGLDDDEKQRLATNIVNPKVGVGGQSSSTNTACTS